MTLIAGILLSALLLPWSRLLPGCAFKRFTGVACATCGLTRGVLALGQGHWGEAFYWYPALGLLLLLAPGAMLWDLHRAWRGQPYPSLPDSRGLRLWLWGLLGLIWALQVVRGI
jgi:hypothetical protein